MLRNAEANSRAAATGMTRSDTPVKSVNDELEHGIGLPPSMNVTVPPPRVNVGGGLTDTVADSVVDSP